MSYAKVYSRATQGIHSPEVSVEAHLSNGQPAFLLVGLPETVVKESKERVRSAILSSHFMFPYDQRITVNLAPASLPKQGGRFDLAIALAILAASKQLPAQALTQLECAGELSLSGQLHSVRGILSWVLSAQSTNRQLIIPQDNEEEAQLVFSDSQEVCLASHLLAVCEHIRQISSLPKLQALTQKQQTPKRKALINHVRGQALAKKALLLAAAGGHHLLFFGPPGSGKTMLASCLSELLPPLTQKEAVEVAMIKSLHPKGFNPTAWRQRPFQSPHHNTSVSAMIGGGRPTSPGNISLAHHGVLFLDEFPEYPRAVLEALREPIESGCIHVARVGSQATYPARFQLIAAMNPCPCGFYDDGTDRCRCSANSRQRYRDKLSGPLMDRIDLHCEVKAIPPKAFWSPPHHSNYQHENLIVIIQQARLRQKNRQGMLNSQLSWSDFENRQQLTPTIQQLLSHWMKEKHFSTRRALRLLRLGQTQADLEEVGLQAEHLEQMLVFSQPPQ